ncbi:hypothetical protein [Erythrobacter oryzae]|uniref:hypothetical protein n=1 Tax=Erythrobacter oryzae TaxID=3019556 RepID=UPI00255732B3|nr:hypothetical protein [Erythrobacter sp. COR-2]
MTMEEILIAGGLIGFGYGMLGWSRKAGWVLLALIATGMIAIVAIRQAMSPDSLRSTSALEFLVVPLWPCLGAFCGWSLGAFARALVNDR